MAVTGTLKDNGISVAQMVRMSGANRSTIYRWMTGAGGQPDYNLVNNLARAVWRRYPDQARELVEASGYAWAEPEPESEPPPIPPEVLQVINDAPRDEQWKRDAIEALEAIERERNGGDESSPGRRAG
jgi:transcriptional regulator with XRE-family HTH domain